MNIWLVGQWKGTETPWEVQGVFDSEQKAIAACVDDQYFIGPLTLNEEMPQETMREWPGAYYPKAKPAEA